VAINDYFLYLLPNGVKPVQTAEHGTVYEGQSILKISDVRNALVGLGKKVKDHTWSGRNGFMVDDSIVFSPNVEDGLVMEIMVQGSLSWFPEGLADIYKVGETLAKKVPVTFYLHNEMMLGTDSEKAFIDAMLSRYEPKLAAFKTKYGVQKLKVDADGFFRTNGNGWKNLFGILG